MVTVIIDGQGGKMGAAIVAALKAKLPETELTAVGTNSIATSAMLKAGADFGATGENAVAVNCRTADLIIGPLGIIAADALLGEVTPAMAAAVGQSRAKKILLPTSRCNLAIAGMPVLPPARVVQFAVEMAEEYLQKSVEVI